MNPYRLQFMELFMGNLEAHGKFIYDGRVTEAGKVKGKGVTIRSKVTDELWSSHLEGKDQLGIIPISQKSTTKFGAIDIDDYTIKATDVHTKIVQFKIPVTIFRSKSGGCHLFLFTTEFVTAELMQAKLREISSFLGYGNAEIFPKQTRILAERGDVGQWINMPYFGLEKTERYAYDDEVKPILNPADFFAYMAARMVTPDELVKLEMPLSLQEIPHGPPCLQHLAQRGFPDGTRNQGLFNLGVYAQKVSPDRWQGLIEDYNNKYMKPPLSPKEVLVVIASLSKKEYTYACKKEPICSYCNITVCRTRKYGIGLSAGMPSFGTLTKLDSDPPIWFLDVDGGGRLELSTEDLQTPIRFQKRCLDALNLMPVIYKREQWQIVVTKLLENIVTVPVPKAHTYGGQLMLYLEEFCINRAGDDSADCLDRGLIWNHDKHHHFRLVDFLQFLERKRFNDLSINKIVSILRDHDAQTTAVRVSGKKNLTVYRIRGFVDIEDVPESQDERLAEPGKDKIPF